MQRFLSRFLPLVIVCTFTAGADSCSSGGNPGPTFVTDIALKDAAGVVQREFAPGEPITLELSVRNRTRTEAVLEFPSGHQFDFAAVDPGQSPFVPDQIRWLWSRGRAFTLARTEIRFAPEETKTFTVIWDQLDDARLPLDPGNYEARGVMVFGEFAADPLIPHQLGSPLRPFTIR